MGKKHVHVAIIVPVYNEAKVIKRVVRSLHKYFPHVVCVNDGSSDQSADQILEAGAYLVEHPFNMGQGAALQTGAEFARQLKDVRYYVHFDADGQHQVDDVRRMLEELETGKYDIILGSRFLGTKAVGMKTSKKLLLRAAVAFSNSTTGVRLTDTHNGLRAFNQHVADTLQITQPDMSHASEILDLIHKNGYRYKEVPVTIVYSDYSIAKGQTHINAVNIGFDGLLRKFSK